jgi:hypothetical protein
MPARQPYGRIDVPLSLLAIPEVSEARARPRGIDLQETQMNLANGERRFRCSNPDRRCVRPCWIKLVL